MRNSTLDEHRLQKETTAVLNGVHRDVDMTPWERIAQANQMALEAAKDPYIRQAAVAMLAGCQNVPARGGRVIAKWLRKNVTYSAEAPGVEVLQGPFTTLALRHADCDDFAITWASLARSVGLDAYVAGIAEKSAPDMLLHAVGYDNGLGAHWELSLDRRWGGNWLQPLVFKRPTEYLSVWWSPEDARKGYWVDEGQGYKAVDSAPEPTEGTETMMIRCDNPYLDPSTKGAPSAAPPGSDGGGGLGEQAAADAWGWVNTLIGGLAGQAPGALLGTDEGLDAPPELPDFPVQQQVASPGVPTWIWGLLGLGAVGGLVYYVAKK